MSSRSSLLRGLPILLLAGWLIGLPGCTSLVDTLFPVDSSRFAEEERRREEYLATHESEHIRWLLNNRVQNGMSKGDIDRIVGEDGDRVFNDQGVLTSESVYRTDDLVYSWGPDSSGTVYMLVFRDNRLINYENFGEPGLPTETADLSNDI
ncbi:hypothetical protein [Rubinisphaera margarita]|uniref:hypothetical protein n=1 Tax=Rubinisphaera margarita TaxID=2909586 RepID=UPI001EE7B01B|nr:hypothetical protein [Rubinisphaera margarita]MCG6155523.1 hypothetical protein [Rubinisphaera margarita]